MSRPFEDCLCMVYPVVRKDGGHFVAFQDCKKNILKFLIKINLRQLQSHDDDSSIYFLNEANGEL
jgi:hypothetical protein